MSRMIRTSVLLSLAVAVVAVSTSTASAGCRRYRRSYYPRHTVVHRVVKPVVVQPRVVHPVKPSPQLPSVPAGSTLTLPGSFLGPQAGHVFLVLNEVKLPAKIENWNPNGVTITLPPMAVKQPTPSRLDVILPQGKIARRIKILLTPPSPVVLHNRGIASPQPTAPPASGGAAQAAAAAAGPQVGLPVVHNKTP